jgi:hypothetical protein
VLLLLVLTTAPAAARPRVSLVVPATVEAGTPFSVTWRGNGVPHGTQLLLEKPVGTARVWKLIVPALRGQSGTANLPAYPMLGSYRLRVAATRHRRVIASREATIHVFANVPFASLLESTSPLNFRTGVHATPVAAFSYAYSVDVEKTKPGFITDEHSACNFVHLEVVLGGEEGAATGQLTLLIVQERAEPVSLTVQPEEVRALDANLALGDSWAVNGSSTTRTPFGDPIFINGYAHCDQTGHVKAQNP